MTLSGVEHMGEHMSKATCHPGRPAYRLGICRQCYKQLLKQRKEPAACHPERHNYFSGLCKTCFRESKRRPAMCHQDRPEHAKGLCQEFYDRQRPSTKRRAKCHPKRAEYRQGLCITCYRRLKQADKPRAKCHPEEPEKFMGLCVSCYGRRANTLRKRATCHPDMPRVTADGLCCLCRKRERIFGLTPDDYEAILKLQGGVCAICGKVFSDADNRSRESACVDHDHITGSIRGILCVACNAGIGQMQDSPQILQKAIEYLKNPPVSGHTIPDIAKRAAQNHK